MLLAITLLGGLLHWSSQPAIAATQIDIPGPIGSGQFGTSVTVLPNGNIVVTDPYYDSGSAVDVGAVYLYNGASGALISMLTGTTANDQVGNWEVILLPNGNYLVVSPYWDNSGATDAGAVTWGNGTSGVSGAVSALNSLVGSTANDQVGSQGVILLSNGNYVVPSPYWDNSGATDAGAVTWGNGTSGVSGAVSAANSLVGSKADDDVGGYPGVIPLSNGNYVVSSPDWDNGTVTDAGAVTWGNGTSGVSGAVSDLNSLVGSKTNDAISGGIHGGGVTPLSNGNYVVSSADWDNGGATDAGAVTWGNGTTGTTGVVSAANSLVGSMVDDIVGNYGAIPLSNGNYVVPSPYWDNGSATNAGAATWGDGTSGVFGVISAANSLVGSAAGNQVALWLVTPLSNGNYVVRSPWWDNGTATNAGAVTWGNGTTGTTGVVSTANSLVGNTTDDRVGSEDVIPLSNGNYVVRSPSWDNGPATDVGAVTWGNGTIGTTGAVSAANSLVGSTVNDTVGGYPGVIPLSNGNYVVRSPWWDNGAVTDAGAVTWGNGTSGVFGVISAANSLVGSTTDDRVGSEDVTLLSNGNYVVRSPAWDNGPATDVGAVTWGSGTSGVSGVVSAANSLVGSKADDRVGIVIPLSNGNYVVSSSDWDNGTTTNAGAVTWGSGTSGISGAVSTLNSLVGSTTDDQVGWYVTPLSNSNYVVQSPNWDNNAVTDAGAVTWENGTTGTTGAVSALNSLVGSTANDWVGSEGVTPLSNGNYVVSSTIWALGVGAVTWGDGTTGTTGVVSDLNSLVGSTTLDQVGSGGVTPLSNGNYVVSSPTWDYGAVADAGAVTWGNGTSGTSGAVSAANSVRGATADGGYTMVFQYDPINSQLVVGRPADNIVTLFTTTKKIYLPIINKQ